MTKKVSKYRIVLSDVNPASSKAVIFAHRCYFGVSINNKFIEGKHFERLLKWISVNFPYCLLVVGDYLNRFNELILGKTHEEKIAAELSYRKGIIIKENILRILTRNNITNIGVESSLSIFQQPEFQEHYCFVQEEISKNTIAIKSIESTAIDFLKRNNHDMQLADSFNDKVCLSKKYIIEELGIFSFLIGIGFVVQVYPGTHLDILKKIANGELSLINSNLNNGIYVDLSVKKVK